MPAKLGEDAPEASKYRTRPHALGMRPGFDPTRLNQLVDELETDVYLERKGPLKREDAPQP
ncbi:MAG: hypothetical protein F4Y45_03905 [Acidobacteria bacterium]|nr:hypothetical protein [Acidobacteriota bacterium]MXZ72625.1 hypothetical protein [Acidobacteriota bacterium]MYJ03779.1 hypothetical protein [Acidobacteriota bacterium]